MFSLRQLNKQQRKAAETIEGPLLVLSGAGTGKTRTITYRIANMLDHGIPAANILSVTFTNKAAREMVERAKKLVGPAVNDMQVSTFHSFGLRIIRENLKEFGLRRNFTIYDSKDQVAIVKKALRSISVSWKDYKAEDVLYTINKLRTPYSDEIDFSGIEQFDAAILQGVWERYRRALRTSNAVDFEDLLFFPVKLFKTHKKILTHYQNIFKYILVDEYQDTNSVQFDLIHSLAKNHDNLCVVGDDDQSIYGWRGAEVRNILDFEKRFKGAVVVRLEENYRSTTAILDVANSVIKKNINRKEKKLWSSKIGSEVVRALVAPDEMGEAELVVSDIISHKRRHDTKFGDYSILMRMNTQARQFEEVLRTFQIPYVVVGGMQFYDRKEIKDFLSYLKILVNPNDEEAFLRVVNVPPRAIGEKSIDRLGHHAANGDRGLYESIADLETNEEIAINARNGFINFYKFIEKYREKLKTILKPSIIIREMWKELQYEKELMKVCKTLEAVNSRLANVESFIDGIAYYEQKTKKPSLENYLRMISLDTNDDDEEMKNDKLALMTIHSSKGLEFPYVYIVGAEQGIIPHRKSLLSDSGLSEERRLFYVAITRAEQMLTISYPKARMKFGTLEQKKPSEFLEDIPDNLIEWHENAYDQTVSEEETAMNFSEMKNMFADTD